MVPVVAPKVSVLVPSYNKRAHIEETLRSVYAQEGVTWELIVVDDGSTDGSAALLSEHRERATIILGPNRGASAARQAALSRARGEYIQYLDADDVLLSDALSRRVQVLEASGADVGYCDWQRLVPAGDGSFIRGDIVARTIEDVDPDPEIACATNFWCPPVALLYRRSLTDRMPAWHVGLAVIQDARYLLEAALLGARFVRVPGVLALYRDDPSNSLSRRDAHAFARDVALNAMELEARWRARAELSPQQRNALARSHDYVARTVFRGDRVLFDQSVARLQALDELRPLGWPNVAAQLQRGFGTRGATLLLALLRRPAP